jgi:hypothetical protein
VNLQEIITLAIAIYGAVLATLTMVMAIRRDRRSLAVRMKTAMFTYDDRLGPRMLEIEVANTGHRELVVDAPQLKISGDERRSIVLMDAHGLRDFPKRLAQGERAAVRIEFRDVAMTLQREGHAKARIYAVCKDSAGHAHRSKPWAVDVQEWLKGD